MTTRDVLLPRSTNDAVRRIAQGYLADATRALDRLGDRKDGEALHDFRVAIRRLRSLLRAYRRWVPRAGAGKVRLRLRDLGAATNAGRDAEVQITWLEAQRGTLARGERTGLNWILRRLRMVKRESYSAARCIPDPRTAGLAAACTCSRSCSASRASPRPGRRSSCSTCWTRMARRRRRSRWRSTAPSSGASNCRRAAATTR